MILSEEYVLRAIELRIKTKPIVGTLCRTETPHLIHNAMKYFDIWNYGVYISHPYTTFTVELFDNMTEDLFKIFITMMHHYLPPCTSDEISCIIYYSEKLNYKVTVHNNILSFRKGGKKCKSNLITADT